MVQKYDRLDHSKKTRNAVKKIVNMMEEINILTEDMFEEKLGTQNSQELKIRKEYEEVFLASSDEWKQTSQEEKDHFFKVCNYVWDKYYKQNNEPFFVAQFYYILLLLQLLYYERYEKQLTEIHVFKHGERSLYCYGAFEYAQRRSELDNPLCRLSYTSDLDGLVEDIFIKTKNIAHIKKFMYEWILRFYKNAELIKPEEEVVVS